MTANVWITAARPKTLFVALSPVLLGTAFAFSQGKGHLLSALGCLLMALSIQIFVNYTNDYNDFLRGADNEKRIGPLRVMQAGLLTVPAMLKGVAWMGIFAMLCSIALAWRGGWPMTMICAVSLLAAFCYTGGPYPYGYHGMGELFVFPFFGPVALCGTYYVQTLEVSALAFVISLVTGMLSCAVIVAANIRDIDTDPKAGKFTLAVRLGRKYTRVEYLLLIAIAALIPPLLYLFFDLPASVMMAWIALPLFVKPAKAILTKTDGPSLIAALAGTAQGTFCFSLFLGIGFLL